MGDADPTAARAPDRCATDRPSAGLRVGAVAATAPGGAGAASSAAQQRLADAGCSPARRTSTRRPRGPCPGRRRPATTSPRCPRARAPPRSHPDADAGPGHRHQRLRGVDARPAAGSRGRARRAAAAPPARVSAASADHQRVRTSRSGATGDAVLRRARGRGARPPGSAPATAPAPAGRGRGRVEGRQHGDDHAVGREAALDLVPLCSESVSRTPGCSASSSASTPGNSAVPMHGVVSTVSDSVSIARSAPTAERAEPTPATISRACRAKTSPAAVRVAGRRLRSISRTPSSRSSAGDVRAHPGLRAVHLLGRGREPPAVDDREEGLQPVQLHWCACCLLAPGLRPRVRPQDSGALITNGPGPCEFRMVSRATRAGSDLRFRVLILE